MKITVAKPKNRIRRKGGGRKPAIEIIENIDEVFLKIIDAHIAGDPMNGKIRWGGWGRPIGLPDCFNAISI